MASRIQDAYLDLLTLLQSIKDANGDQLYIYFNIWDNQIDEMETGMSYSFNTPACFVEFDMGEAKMIGGGLTTYPDTIVRFHLCNVILHSEDNMEQNMPIFDVRDFTRSAFGNANIRWCSTFMPCEDKQDFRHKNLYKYVLSFKTNFIDNKGSIFDPNTGFTFGYLVNPTINLNLFFYWNAGQTYKANQNLVGYKNNLYLCLIDNNDLEFDTNKWMLINGWIAANQYQADNVAVFESKAYKCIEANDDTVFDINKWTLITQG